MSRPLQRRIKPGDPGTPPPVSPADVERMTPAIHRRARWLLENPTYSRDAVAGSAPHPQPCVQNGGFKCGACAVWSLAVTRGETVEAFLRRFAKATAQ